MEKDFDLEARIERIENVLSTVIDLEAFDRGEAVIRGNRFMALNKSGQLRACLGVNRANNRRAGSLYLLDRDGNLSAVLSAVSDRGGALTLFDPGEQPKLRVEVDSEGQGRVRTFNTEREESIVPA